MLFSFKINGKDNTGGLSGDLLDIRTSLEFSFYPSSSDVNNKKELNYSIKWRSGERILEFTSSNYVLFLHPKNELLRLAEGIKNFLDSEQKKTYRFEPAEPCFELTLEKYSESSLIKIYLWLDNGNFAESAYYTWDALGFRLCCERQELELFAEGIRSYFKT